MLLYEQYLNSAYKLRYQICSIESTESFPAEVDDRLTAEEQKEAQKMVEEADARRKDNFKYLEAQRKERVRGRSEKHRSFQSTANPERLTSTPNGIRGPGPINLDGACDYEPSYPSSSFMKSTPRLERTPSSKLSSQRKSTKKKVPSRLMTNLTGGIRGSREDNNGIINLDDSSSSPTKSAANTPTLSRLYKGDGEMEKSFTDFLHREKTNDDKAKRIFTAGKVVDNYKGPFLDSSEEEVI